MKNYFSIGEAAKAVDATSENFTVLRSYRIGKAQSKGQMD